MHGVNPESQIIYIKYIIYCSINIFLICVYRDIKNAHTVYISRVYIYLCILGDDARFSAIALATVFSALQTGSVVSFACIQKYKGTHYYI